MRTLLVVDASVAVKWVMPENYSGEALALLRDHLEDRVEALQLITESEPMLEEVDKILSEEALRISLDLGVTVYDAAYLALASRLRATFYTADERLLSNPKVRRLGIAKHITKYQPPDT